MTRQATPKAIAAYREKLLTNPASLLTNMRRTRETLRERSEQVFIDRDLTTTDKVIDDDVRKEELERLDEVILRVGSRIDDLDKQIEAHIEEHPDAELLAKIGPQGLQAPSGAMSVSRQTRRARERAQVKAQRRMPAEKPESDTAAEPTPISKSEAKRLKVLTAQDPTDPDPARKPAPETAEEAPEAEE